MLHNLKRKMPDLCRHVDYQDGNTHAAAGIMTNDEFDAIVDDIFDTLYKLNTGGPLPCIRFSTSLLLNSFTPD